MRATKWQRCREVFVGDSKDAVGLIGATEVVPNVVMSVVVCIEVCVVRNVREYELGVFRIVEEVLRAMPRRQRRKMLAGRVATVLLVLTVPKVSALRPVDEPQSSSRANPQHRGVGACFDGDYFECGGECTEIAVISYRGAAAS